MAISQFFINQNNYHKILKEKKKNSWETDYLEQFFLKLLSLCRSYSFIKINSFGIIPRIKKAIIYDNQINKVFNAYLKP